jgi:hypothetical protein
MISGDCQDAGLRARIATRLGFGPFRAELSYLLDLEIQEAESCHLYREQLLLLFLSSNNPFSSSSPLAERLKKP